MSSREALEAGGATFTALILAGSRPGGDPLARAIAVSHKALLPIGGTPMLVHVVRALRASPRVRRILVCGIDEAALVLDPLGRDLVATGAIELVGGAATPSTSVLHVLDRFPGCLPLLITTADHPLLSREILDSFCAAALECGADVALALVPAQHVRSSFPSSRRTLLRLRNGSYCGANLFALLTAQARRAPAAWAEIERHRKHPWRMVRRLGVWALMRFLLRRLSLDETIRLASERIGARAEVILLPHAEAAVDVDTPEDLALVSSIIAGRPPTSGDRPRREQE